MTSAEDEIPAELQEIAGDDPRRAELLYRSLQRLRDGAGGSALQEMASDVLAGRASLRAAIGFSYYQDALTEHLQRFRDWQRDTEPDEVTRAVGSAREALDDP